MTALPHERAAALERTARDEAHHLQRIIDEIAASAAVAELEADYPTDEDDYSGDGWERLRYGSVRLGPDGHFTSGSVSYANRAVSFRDDLAGYGDHGDREEDADGYCGCYLSEDAYDSGVLPTTEQVPAPPFDALGLATEEFVVWRAAERERRNAQHRAQQREDFRRGWDDVSVEDARRFYLDTSGHTTSAASGTTRSEFREYPFPNEPRPPEDVRALMRQQSAVYLRGVQPHMVITDEGAQFARGGLINSGWLDDITAQHRQRTCVEEALAALPPAALAFENAVRTLTQTFTLTADAVRRLGEALNTTPLPPATHTPDSDDPRTRALATRANRTTGPQRPPAGRLRRPRDHH